MKLAYFVHDLTDPAVLRRVRMLKAGGAEPVVLGFRRAEHAPESIEGCPTYDLGRTYDGRLGHRAVMAAKAAVTSGRWRRALAGAEVVMGRTLEMLAVAQSARVTCGLEAPLAYECLDIHRVMLQPGGKGWALRAVERSLMRNADLLVVSSPAFLEHYFRPVQGVGLALHLPTLLIENKVLDLTGQPATSAAAPPPGPPWRVGWMGAIRCRRSLDFLTDLAARRPDLVEVRIHGRPAYSEFADFDAQVAAAPGVMFGGAYRPEDLPRLYGEVHFSWAIDFMEEGLNSAWLLPNRIYESSRHGAAPIALAHVETGRWLAARDLGVRLADIADLEGALDALTPESYAQLKGRIEAVPADVFTADLSDCRRLVERLRSPAADKGSYGEAADIAGTRLAA